MPVEFNWKREGGAIVSASSLPKEASVNKIRVRMLVDKKASLDGLTETLLKKGEYYSIQAQSAGQLIDRHYCVEDKALDVPKETKSKSSRGKGKGKTK